MPVFHNTNEHNVTAKDEGGKVVRIRAGRAKSVDGVAADQLAGYNGVREVSGDEAEQLLAGRQGASGDLTTESELGTRAAQARAAATHAVVSAPLQVVVGDDSAPLAPPSGTVTTKQVMASKGQVERQAFADHEPLIGERHGDVDDATGLEAGPVSEAAVHNAQETARKVVEGVVEGETNAEESAVPAGTETASDAPAPKRPRSRRQSSE